MDFKLVHIFVLVVSSFQRTLSVYRPVVKTGSDSSTAKRSATGVNVTGPPDETIKTEVSCHSIETTTMKDTTSFMDSSTLYASNAPTGNNETISTEFSTTTVESPAMSKTSSEMSTNPTISPSSTTPSSGGGSTEILGKGVRVFTSGGNLSLTCEYSSTTDLSQSDLQELKFYDKSGVEFGSTRNFMQAHTTLSTRKISVTLTKASVDRSDAGKYVCKFKNANDFQIDVAIVHFTTVEDVYNMTAGSKQTNKLKCDYTIEKENSVQLQDSVKWEREGKSVDKVSTRHKANGTVLTIENAEWSDVGPYNCIVTLTWGSSNSEMVTSIVPLKGAPKIGKMDASKNVVQEDDVEIKCDVSGYPYPTVKWFKDGKELRSDKRITISDAGMYENAILTINNLEFEDKGEYTCNATSSENLNGVTATIVIRVKDKLAALWPFLGIVAEVIVLCVIIFIYEKKRSREMEDEADGGDDVVHSDDHKGKDVRQRNVRT